MKNFFRLYRRHGGVYYAEEIATRRQESLKTRDKATADQLLSARNAAAQQPLLNLAVARVHLAAHDPKMISRTWQRVMDEFCTHGRDSTRERSLRAFKSHAFDPMKNQPILEATAEDFLSFRPSSNPSATTSVENTTKFFGRSDRRSWTPPSLKRRMLIGRR